MRGDVRPLMRAGHGCEGEGVDTAFFFADGGGEEVDTASTFGPAPPLS
jgi:hypothetical protein